MTVRLSLFGGIFQELSGSFSQDFHALFVAFAVATNVCVIDVAPHLKLNHRFRLVTPIILVGTFQFAKMGFKQALKPALQRRGHKKDLPHWNLPCGRPVFHNRSTGLALVHHHIMAAAAGPNPQQRPLVGGIGGQVHGGIRVFHGMMVDLLNDIARLEARVGRRR